MTKPTFKFISKTSLILFIFTLIIILTYAQPSQSAPPPPGSTSPENAARAMASRMIDLENKALANQNAVIELQTSELNRLEASPPDGPDKDGIEARKRFNMLGAQQRQIMAQLKNLGDKLMRIPRQDQPRNLMMELRELRNIREEQRNDIKKGFKEIKNRLSGDDADNVPDDDINSGSDEGDSEDETGDENTTDDSTAPETVKEATDIIGGGKLKTPKQLIEIFERISPDETPTGTLDYYRRQHM